MEDELKVKKAAALSAARKKLKEFKQQQKNQGIKKIPKLDVKEHVNKTIQNKNTEVVLSENVTPIESISSSTHSLVGPHHDTQALSETSSSQQINLVESDANYFNTSFFQKQDDKIISVSNYFDTFATNTKSNVNHVDPLLITMKNENNMDHESKNTEYADPFNYVNEESNSRNIESGHVYTNNHIAVEDPEIKQNNYSCGNQVNISNNFENSVDSINMQFESAFENNAIKYSEKQRSPYSNTESLRQLSSQLNSLIDSETVQNVSQYSELEQRNQELASLLQNEELKSDQLNLQLREYMTRVSQLETELQQMNYEYETKISKEIGPLQEQLQSHVQTVGILIGERTELTMALNQSQTTAKQKTSECEELQLRLRAVRHRCSELEKEINSFKMVKENKDKKNQEISCELERLKLEYSMLNGQISELNDESMELREKLNIKTNEILNLQQELQDKNSQLSLSQLRIQQLTAGENLQTESQIETLNQQKISLEKQMVDLTQTVKLISGERDQASQQYQQYVQQLNGQVENMASQLQIKNLENENLLKREESLIKHIGDLEKHLQQILTEKQNQATNSESASTTIKELEEKLNSVQIEKAHAEEKLKKDTNKIEEVKKELMEKTLMIEELEGKVERLSADQPDTGKLLAIMESDKVAAARAVEQNNKLKLQLEELHDGFIKMSNSKLELTEKLESEQHHCRELSENLTQRDEDVQHLQATISFKDKELVELQTLKVELNKQILQQNQLLDRLRHYEAQGNIIDLLQQELKKSNKNLETVMTENIELNKLIAELQKELSTENKEDSPVPFQELETDFDGPEQKLSESIQKKIDYLEKMNADLENRIRDLGSDDKSTENEEIKNTQYLDKEKAMEQLEERFKKTMSEVAEITEEKQRLEHLVLQLQSETETIGEYVTLYQCQRAILKEKTLEKDEQLKRLAHEREEMKLKLDQLNSLIQKLMIEKGDIPEEVLKYKLKNNMKTQCEIHSKEDMDNVNNHSESYFAEQNIENNNNDTADKILNLLSEIKSSSLVQPSDNIQNFHPCPWCSGKLITV